MRLGKIAQSILTVTTMIGGTATTASALPIGHSSDYSYIGSSAVPALLAPGVNFLGTVALNNCSGALVRFRQSRPDDRALVLTNGHCLESGLPSPGQVITDAPSRRTFDLMNKDASDVLGTLSAESMLYGTMTDTDVALYLLTDTYTEITQRYGVQPLTVSDKHPTAGAAISIVSAYWRRTYTCSIDNFVSELHEDGWIFRDAIRYTAKGCAVIGGTSGAPIIGTDPSQVIGINNTINEQGGRCTRNNPCEVDQNGSVVVKKGTGYGEQVYLFYGCLDGTGHGIDLNRAGCSLPKPQ